MKAMATTDNKFEMTSKTLSFPRKRESSRKHLVEKDWIPDKDIRE
jgi:hypothetical protein